MATDQRAAGGDAGADADSGKESSGEMWADLFVARLTPETRSSLTPAQLDDIKRAAAAIAPRQHGLDWRFSVPTSRGRRFYGVLLAGSDRRSPYRRAQERMLRRRRARQTGAQVLAVGLALALLVLMLMAGVVHADEAKSGIVGIEGADNRTPIETEKWPWTALGRVNREVGGHCTGALIARTVVLTAAHCLYNFGDNRWTIPMEVHFVAGYHRGEYSEHATGRNFSISPKWDPANSKAEASLANDWALIELDHALSIRPVGLSTLSYREMEADAEDGELTIAGYNRDYAEILTQDHGCHLLGETPGDKVFLHDCDATFGSSGAPLLLMSSAGAEIIGVQSAIVQLDSGASVGAAVPVSAFRKAAEDY